MADRIQLRRDTRANWEAYNPILLEGEPGHVLDDPNLYKMGDGIHAWNDLPYRGYTGTVMQDVQIGVTNSVPSSDAVFKSIEKVEKLVDGKQTLIMNKAAWSDYTDCDLKEGVQYTIKNIGTAQILDISFRKGTTSAGTTGVIAPGNTINFTPTGDADECRAYGDGGAAKFEVKMAVGFVEKLENEIQSEKTRAQNAENALQTSIDNSNTKLSSEILNVEKKVNDKQLLLALNTEHNRLSISTLKKGKEYIITNLSDNPIYGTGGSGFGFLMHKAYQYLKQ